MTKASKPLHRVELLDDTSRLFTIFLLELQPLLEIYGPLSIFVNSSTLDPVSQLFVLEFIVCLPLGVGEDTIRKWFHCRDGISTKIMLERVVTDAVSVVDSAQRILDVELVARSGDAARINIIQRVKRNGAEVKKGLGKLREKVLARYAT